MSDRPRRCRPAPVRLRVTPAVLLLLALAPVPPAGAHGRSQSYSAVEPTETGALVVVRVPRISLLNFPAPPESHFREDGPLARHLAASLRLASADGPCTPGPPRRRAAPEDYAVFEWEVRCPGGPAVRMESRLFEAWAPSHLHFARVATAAGPVEKVLAAGDRRFEFGGEVGSASGAGTGLAGYLLLGVEHILSGWDHLAFVLALLLLARTAGEVARLVTGFTAGHSLTLAAAVVGALRPAPAAVEALIGFSVFLVALENGWVLAGRRLPVPAVVAGALALAAGLRPVLGGAVPAASLLGLGLFSLCHLRLVGAGVRPAGLHVLIALAFGLVHGFGFAGILGELELPRSRLLPALFGFNLGVEIGQLGVVFGLWPLLAALRRLGRGRVFLPVAEGMSAGIAALGLYWFLTRSYG